MRFKITVLLVLGIVTLASAQLRLPSFDIGVKAGYMVLWDDYEADMNYQSFLYEAIGVQGELNLHIGQHLAVGWFYNRSVFANYHEEDGNTQVVDRAAEHLLYGANVRFSAGRSSRLRPYVQAKYSWVQVAVQNAGYRVGNKFTGLGGGVGLMLRASHKLYINLFEVEISTLNKQEALMFDTSNIFPQFRAGLTYNFSKRK